MSAQCTGYTLPNIDLVRHKTEVHNVKSDLVETDCVDLHATTWIKMARKG